MRVMITGSRGMLGSAVLKAMDDKVEILRPNREELDLTQTMSVFEFISFHRPEVVIHTAARVGGIQASLDNSFEFLNENLQIDSNILAACRKLAVPKLFYMGSTCMYPKDQEGALNENDILAGKLEPSNEGYALAKIVGAKTVEIVAIKDHFAWRTLIPSNLYGPFDNFNPNSGHMVASIIQKIDTAISTNDPSVEMWGDGLSRREFTFVDDVADYICESIPIMDSLPITMNVGSGIDLTVREYYELIADIMGYNGEIIANANKPSGMKRKLSDSSLAASHGWNPRTDLRDGLSETIIWYRNNIKERI